MPRQSVPFVLFVPLVLLVTACTKKPDTAGPNGNAPAPEPRGVDSDPNAVYSINVRDARAGDKAEVFRHESTTETRRGGNTGTTKFEKRLEYAEHIIEMPDALPTKLTRNYRVAKRSDPKSGQLEPYPFEGKTVAIAKRGASFFYTVDGKPLPRVETLELDAEFKNADKIRIQALLPDGPVKVGERWPISREVLRAFGQLPMTPDVDYSKSSLSGHFTRAYTLDGKQWGQIAFDFDIVIDPDITGGKVRGLEGTLKIAGTFDVVIDGSTRDSIMKGTVKASLAGRHKAAETKSEVEGTIERSVRMVK